MASEVQNATPVAQERICSTADGQPAASPEMDHVSRGNTLSDVLRSRRIRGIQKLVAVFLVCMLACVLFGNLLHGGSVMIALAYLRGERLIIDPIVAFANDGLPGEEREILFRVLNFTDRPVKLLGANSSCTCASTKDLPLVIPPAESRMLSVTYRFSEAQSSLEEIVTLYTDDRQRSRLVVRIKRRVANTVELGTTKTSL